MITLRQFERAGPGLLVIVAALTLAPACGSEPDARNAAAPAPFECEVQAYACTWDEVPPEVVARTKTLAELGALYERSGASIENVAAFLRSQPGVPYVETIDTGVRFRLENGRPAWIYPGNELNHHQGDPATADDIDLLDAASPRAPSAMNLAGTVLDAVEQWLVPPAYAQEEPPSGVADDEPGTGKRALILAPFEWQYPGHGYTTAARAERIRDYKPEAGGEVVYKADLAEFEDNPPIGYDYVDGGVEFEDFLEWDTYNLVVLLSHGSVHYCHSIAPVGGERRVSGQAPDEYPDSGECSLIWAGRAKQESYGAYVGVEIVEYINPMYEDHPGLTIGEVDDCA